MPENAFPVERQQKSDLFELLKTGLASIIVELGKRRISEEEALSYLQELEGRAASLVDVNEKDKVLAGCVAARLSILGYNADHTQLKSELREDSVAVA